MLRQLVIMVCLLGLPLLGIAQDVDNLLENHSFEDDSDDVQQLPGWTSWFSQGNAEVAFSYVDDAIDGAKSMMAEILKPSATNWHIGLIQPVREIKAGKTYTLTFWAKAAKTRPIGMEVKRDPALGGWEGVADADFIIQTDWEEFTNTFTAVKDYPDGQSQLDFWLAEDDATIWFDFVHVYVGDYVLIEPAGFISQAVDAADKLATRWGVLKQR